MLKTDVVVAMQDSVYSLSLLRALLANGHVRVIAVCISESPLKDVSTFRAFFRLTKRVSWRYLWAKIFEVILSKTIFLVSRPFRSYDLVCLSRKYDFVISRANNNSHLLQCSRADRLLLSLNYLYIVEKNIIDRYRKALNFHPALLPFGRGLSPQFHMLRGENLVRHEDKYFYGASVHEITEGIDRGNVILRGYIITDTRITSSTLYMVHACIIGCKLLRWANFNQSEVNSLPPQVAKYLSSKGNLYFSYPVSLQYASFLHEGLEALSVCMFTKFAWGVFTSPSENRPPNCGVTFLL